MKQSVNYQEIRLNYHKHLVRLCRKYPDAPCSMVSARAKKEILKSISSEEQELFRSCQYRFEQVCSLQEEIFIGREKELLKIHESFAGGTGRPVVLYGIGGIGKSALARAYARRFRGEYDHILSLPCQKRLKDTLSSDTALPVNNLQYSPERYRSKNKYFRKKLDVAISLMRESKVLLILDGCTGITDAEMDILLSLPCHILITTCLSGRLFHGSRGIRVEELKEPAEWDLFIDSYCPYPPSREQRRELYEYRDAVGGHTLTMRQAARQLRPDEENFPLSSTPPRKKTPTQNAEPSF